ncbi:gamma-glutamyltransferase [Terrisporobacter mayombei]|uniref:Glutathione hydrolase proenzyme n=1 Tax=Terrisporobacter mayombei TaxID=1541 RepID=A0ABY9Q439_9FIRM|nr:gamma-glutamyltransferase [Terrisporobacter mayombei]MCC3870126.1 gamma-glutamyltransferase [Terrisporobacter mayombei]WMT82364.1 Glutathione hydrolase proenzyme [Terrisporobacter mayombei]
MIKHKKIFVIMLCIITVVTFVTGCNNNEIKKNKINTNEIQIEKIEKPSTGKVSDNKGWELWDDENHLTKEGRSDTGENAVVSSGKYEASQAGLEVIKSGGNAVDAAIATGFALCVVEPNATGIAGGGCMLIRNKEGKNVYIDFRETAPSAANPDMWNLDSKGKVINDENESGGKSVAVPGQVAGLIYAFEKYGSGNLTLEEVMTPAINLAQNGFYVTPTLLKDMKSVQEMINKYPRLKTLILNKKGAYYNVGDLYKNEDLANTLKRISKDGKKAFYEGDIAKSIVDTAKEYGGIITLEDLENYEVEEMEPIQGSYRGKTIISSPLPSSGGTHVIQSLNILENFDISKYGVYSPERYHLLSEVFKLVYEDRTKYAGDPKYVDIPIIGLLNKDYAKVLANKIDINYSQEYTADDPWIYEHEDTTHYSVADKEGNMVAVTQTINWTFGSGLAVNDYGFVLNNEISDFSPESDSPNCVDSGKRPLSSMSPTILLNEDNTPFMVIGSPGGSRIIPTVTEVISNVIDYDMDIQEAIDTYRMYDNTNDKIIYEGGISGKTINKLKSMGHKTEKYEEGYDKHFGGVQGVQYKDGKLIGGADSRRDGKALGN